MEQTETRQGCATCGALPVIAKGHCGRCYRQLNRGKEPLPVRQYPMKAPHHVAVTMPGDLYEFVSYEAERQGVSVAEWVRICVRTEVRNRAEKPSKARKDKQQ